MKHCYDLTATLALYANCSLPDAKATTFSEASAFFDSRAFTEWKKGEEGRAKIAAATVERLNGVIGAINVLIKVMARR